MFRAVTRVHAIQTDIFGGRNMAAGRGTEGEGNGVLNIRPSFRHNHIRAAWPSSRRPSAGRFGSAGTEYSDIPISSRCSNNARRKKLTAAGISPAQ